MYAVINKAQRNVWGTFESPVQAAEFSQYIIKSIYPQYVQDFHVITPEGTETGIQDFIKGVRV